MLQLQFFNEGYSFVFEYLLQEFKNQKVFNVTSPWHKCLITV